MRTGKNDDNLLIRSMGRIMQVIVELAASGREIPIILGCILMFGLCLRFEVDEFNIA